MKKIRELPIELAEKMNVPGELLPGMGSISLSGGRQALVEDHRGILEYSPDRIVVALKRGKLILSGSALYLRAMNSGQLYITGRIQSVEWG